MMALIALWYGASVTELGAEEPRRAAIALEMIQSGDWLVPRQYGLPYLNKPPMHNWLIASFFKIFGHAEWVVRSVGLICYLLTALILGLFVSRQYGRKKGILIGFYYLFSADLFYYFSQYAGELDFTYCLFLLIHSIGLFGTLTKPDRFWTYVVCYTGLLFAIMTKGFGAIHFHLLPLVASFLIYRSRWTIRLVAHLIMGCLMMSCISLYLMQYALHADWYTYYLNQFIEVNDKTAGFTLSGLWDQLTQFPLVLLKLCLPWSIILLYFAYRRRRISLPQDSLSAFSLVYILSNGLVYWLFIDIHDRYIYPFLPYAFILLMHLISSIFSKSIFTYLSYLLLVMAAIRLLWSISILPRIESNQLGDAFRYKPIVQELINRSNHEPIDLFVRVDTNYVTPLIGETGKVTIQPLVPYQLSYYLGAETGHMPVVRDSIQTNRYYLIFKDENPVGHYDSLYQFMENWQHRTMLFIKGK